MSGSQNIHPYQYRLTTADREKLLGQKSLLIWFTGLSGSGKSTLANALELALHAEGFKTFILDGDGVRKGVNRNLGFSKADRMENMRRVGEIASLFLNAGLVTIACFISPSALNRDKVRNIVGKERFFEIYVNTPLEVCEKRDPKGLYKKARAGEIPEFTGITAPYDIPQNPDLVIDTTLESIEESVERLLKTLRERIRR